MKTLTHNGQDFEQSMIEHERWTNAIMRALHELRSASAAGLDRNGYVGSDGGFTPSYISPLAGSVPPPSRR